MGGKGRQARPSFLKKRSKKLLSVWRAVVTQRAPPAKSLFASFSSEKEESFL